MPVSVPELMAAAVVDSLFAEAIAAMLEVTELLPDEADGVLVVIEEPGLAELTPEALFEPTSCPAEVGNAAEAPEGAVEGAGAGAAVPAAAAGAAVDPRSGTAAAAPVEPALM